MSTKANITNMRAGIRQLHCRGTYRTNTNSGYEPYSVVLTSATRVIDMDVQLSFYSPTAKWILVFDTDFKSNTELETGAVPYLPAKYIQPGEHAIWHPRTEWTPFEKNILIVASNDQILNINNILPTDELISSYIRYSTKEMTLGL